MGRAVYGFTLTNQLVMACHVLRGNAYWSIPGRLPFRQLVDSDGLSIGPMNRYRVWQTTNKTVPLLVHTRGSTADWRLLVGDPNRSTYTDYYTDRKANRSLT